MSKVPDFAVETLSAPAKMPDRMTAELLALIRAGDYLPGTRLPPEMRHA